MINFKASHLLCEHNVPAAHIPWNGPALSALALQVGVVCRRGGSEYVASYNREWLESTWRSHTAHADLFDWIAERGRLLFHSSH